MKESTIIRKIQNEVIRRQLLGLIPDETSGRVDTSGAYELYARVNGEQDIDYEKHYFFTVDELFEREQDRKKNNNLNNYWRNYISSMAKRY